jgi:hypothetical protein
MTKEEKQQLMEMHQDHVGLLDADDFSFIHDCEHAKSDSYDGSSLLSPSE